MVDAARLRRSTDIALVRANGTHRNDRLFSVRWLRRDDAGDGVRIAVASMRNVGTAVRRNRARRRIREALRHALAARPTAPPTDLLVMARAAALAAPAAAVRASVMDALRAALGDEPGRS